MYFPYLRIAACLLATLVVVSAAATSPPRGCLICGEGKVVTKPSGIFEYPGEPTWTCGALQQAGLDGRIPLKRCAKLVPLLLQCECAVGELPAPTPSPKVATTRAGSTRAAPVTCPVTPAGQCSICGPGKCISLPAASITVPDVGTITCQMLESAGYGGQVPPEKCNSLLFNFAAAPCGCVSGDASPGTTAPTTSVSPPTASPTSVVVSPPTASPTSVVVSPPTASPTTSSTSPPTSSPTKPSVSPPTSSPTKPSVSPPTSSPNSASPPTSPPTKPSDSPPTSSPTKPSVSPPTPFPTTASAPTTIQSPVAPSTENSPVMNLQPEPTPSPVISAVVGVGGKKNMMTMKGMKETKMMKRMGNPMTMRRNESRDSRGRKAGKKLNDQGEKNPSDDVQGKKGKKSSSDSTDDDDSS